MILFCIACCVVCVVVLVGSCFFFFQAEDGIRDLVRSRGLGDVYKRQRRSRPLSQAAKRAGVTMSEMAAQPTAEPGALVRLSLIHI